MAIQRNKIIGRIFQSASGYWRAKLCDQIKIIKSAKDEKNLPERFLALDISVAFLYLHLFTESTLDYFINNLCTYSMRNAVLASYKKRKRYLAGKIEFVFDNFCSDLTYSEYLRLRNKIKELTKIRNSVVHLEEMSWNLLTSNDLSSSIETPNQFTRLLTEEKLIEQVNSVNGFFEDLQEIVRRGLKNEKYGSMMKIGDKWTLTDEENARDLVDHISSLSIATPIKYEDL